MPKFFKHSENGPGQLALTSSGSWSENIDLDLDASYDGSAPTIPSTATGVILRFQNKVDHRNIGARSSDDNTSARITDLYGGSSLANAYVKLNSDHKIDVYVEAITSQEVWVVGYFEGEAEFFTYANQYTFNAASTNTWHEIDLSSYLDSDAVFAIIETHGVAFSYGYNFCNPNGDSDARTSTYGQHDWLIVPCDSQKVRLWSESASRDFTLVGQITSNASVYTSGTSVSLGTTGSYAEVDLSAGSTLTVPANAVFAVVEIYSSSALRKWGVQRDGETSYTDIYGDTIKGGCFALFPVIDSSDTNNETCEAKIEDTGVDFYIWGWLESSNTSTGWSGKVLGLSIAKINGLEVKEVLGLQENLNDYCTF